MAGKYNRLLDAGTDYETVEDIVELFEPQVHTAASGFGTADGSLFKGEGPFQQAGTNTVNSTLDDYKVNSEPFTAVKRGCYPYLNATGTSNKGKPANCFHKITSYGTYTISRSNSTLKIGSSTFSASDFSCGEIPSQIIVFLVGAGAGGGGRGMYVKDKDESWWVAGGTGGRGGLAVARIDLTAASFDDIQVTVGQGLAAGSDGSSDELSAGYIGKGNNRARPDTIEGLPEFEKIAVDAHYGNGTSSGYSSITIPYSAGYTGALYAYPGEGGHGGNYDGNQAVGCAGTGGTGKLSNSTGFLAYAVGTAGATSLAFNPYSGTGSSSVTITVGSSYGKGGSCTKDGGATAGSNGAAFFFY